MARILTAQLSVHRRINRVQTTECGRDQKIGASLHPLLMYVNGTEVTFGQSKTPDKHDTRSRKHFLAGAPSRLPPRNTPPRLRLRLHSCERYWKSKAATGIFETVEGALPLAVREVSYDLQEFFQLIPSQCCSPTRHVAHACLKMDPQLFLRFRWG